MAEVHLARALGDPRQVVYALKCILPHFADDPRFVQMFHRELTIASGLCHPNLVSVLDHGREQGRHFMVMEYVHGPDLSKLLRVAGKRGVRPSLSAAISILVAAARGLHYLHEAPGPHGGAPGFVHRDVSPSNILLSYEGRVKVADFGVATASAHTRTTEAGGLKGKLGYMSPEQCKAEAVDRRSDIFALGVLLYESTLGERLYYAENDYAIMHQIVSGEFEAPSTREPSYPPELESIILTALAGDPAARYPTANAFADALEAFAAGAHLQLGANTIAAWVTSLVPHEPYPSFIEASPSESLTPIPRLPPPAQPSSRRRSPLVIAGVAAAALTAVGVGVAVRGTPPPVAAAPVTPTPHPPATAAVAQPAPAETPAPAVETTPVATPTSTAPAPHDPAPEVAPVATPDEPPPAKPTRQKPRRRPRKKPRNTKRNAPPPAPAKPVFDELDAPRPPR